jgi:hypothetical protein
VPAARVEKPELDSLHARISLTNELFSNATEMLKVCFRCLMS